MSVQQSIVNWFVNNRGKLTYSMYGSRNGADGTADCSGSISQALKEAGIGIQGLPSTVTLGQQLAKNGFYRVSINQDWDALTGDIVMMSWGADMSQSGGAGGHVGVMMDSVNFISCDYSTQGAVGKAINTYPWNDYYAANKPSYIEVWRYADSAQQTNNKANTAVAPQQKAYYEANEVKYVNGIYQIKCDYLVPIGFDWVN
ncbi:endolysin [Streptococcus phage SW18]|uniref:Lysin n=1 Tax=Streptococcus phage SW18 TaxID=2419638 RepID=A0A3S7WA38_9CAUD|nr:endolysin [Streptococcus phage SW18]AYP29650.1 lysin [Streptococcus phage SW18]